MQSQFLGQPGPANLSNATPLRITDRFDPDREQLASLYARLGKKRAEKKIAETLRIIGDLVVIVQSKHKEIQFDEMAATLAALKDISAQIGLDPVVRAVTAVEGALETEHPHAIGATMARLRRVAERAPSGIWPYCA